MPANHKFRAWTDADRAVLTALFADARTADLAQQLDRTERGIQLQAKALGLRKSADYVLAATLRNRTPKFEAGQEPWNKGTIGVMPLPAHAFRPGHMPHTHRPVGSERYNVDGTLMRKVADTRRKGVDWRPVKDLVFEQHHGPIPPGHFVVHLDRNQRNLAPDNLIAVTRKQHLQRNSIHQLPPELAELLRLRKKIARAANQITQRHDTDDENRTPYQRTARAPDADSGRAA